MNSPPVVGQTNGGRDPNYQDKRILNLGTGQRAGRKPLVAISILVASIMVMVFSYSPIFMLSVGLLCTVCLLVGMMDASSSLIIEQLPLYAGIMISLQRVETQAGSSK